jgi:hypothetical protein
MTADGSGSLLKAASGFKKFFQNVPGESLCKLAGQGYPGELILINFNVLF